MPGEHHGLTLACCLPQLSAGFAQDWEHQLLFSRLV